MRRIWSALLICVLLLAALPLSVFAQEPVPATEPQEEVQPQQTPSVEPSVEPVEETPEQTTEQPPEEEEEKKTLPIPAKPKPVEDKEESVRQEARWVYRMCQGLAQRESFTGFCGLMTSYQLWVMGINDWLLTNDGNKQFDTYSAMEKTSGGHYTKAYSAQEYSLEEALNVITRDGTRDAYNIIVGFEWTETEAGSIYGHACVINAILDGQVYFVESFYTSLGGAEGNVIVCSIPEFAAYFSDWMRYEGLVYFGTKSYADACDVYGTDVFVQARFDTVLRSEPCLVNENDCRLTRTVIAGERLRGDALVVNPQGEMYYRITDGASVGYVAANAVHLIRENGEDLSASDVKIPARAKYGNDFAISGTVTAASGKIGAVEVMVTDSRENIVLRERAEIDGYSCELDILNEDLLFDLLERGTYQVRIYADAACTVAGQVGPEVRYARTCLWEQTLEVDSLTPNPAARMDAEMPVKAAVEDGWVFKNGTWYLYKNGTPRTGWAEHTGVQYYLREDGAVSTGWTEVGGVLRHFSATGALSAGWLDTPEGMKYCSCVGVALTGWQIIDGARYFFDENGLMKTEGSLQVGEKLYLFHEDGRVEETVQNS